MSAKEEMIAEVVEVLNGTDVDAIETFTAGGMAALMMSAMMRLEVAPGEEVQVFIDGGKAAVRAFRYFRGAMAN